MCNTFEEDVEEGAQNEEPRGKKVRMLIEEQIISGLKLEETLEEFGISVGQVIYVEFYDEVADIWPTDKQKGS